MLLIAVPVVVILVNLVWDLYSRHATGLARLLPVDSLAARPFGGVASSARSASGWRRVCHPASLHDGAPARRDLHEFRLPLPAESIILGVSNSQFFGSLFGDSSAIVTYMRHVGWNLNTVYQTGSNMGTDQKHDNPLLCNIGSGTMVSDGLKMINMQMSATSFRLAESKIGDNNFLGNNISYPPNARTGTNVLFGTKTMVPIDGPVRENIGLLGSPAFEIPRKVDRDRDINTSFDEQTRRARLRRKNSYNFVTALIFLASQWVAMFVAFVLGQAGFASLRSFRHLRVLRSQCGAHRLQHGLLHRARARGPGLQATQAAARLDLRSVFLVARKVLEVKGFPDLDHVRRHPVPRHAASRHGHEGRRQAVRLQRGHPGTLADRGRRLRQSERGLCVAGTLARGRRVQVRLHPARQQMLGRPRGLSSLRRQHRRRRRARRRFLPDEGRDPGLSYGVVRKSGQAGAPPRGSGRGLRPGRRRPHRPKRVRPGMSDKVKLKKVTADNWEAVVELELGAGQEDLVASNLYSVAEAQFDPDARPHAVYAWKRVVGFLMYDVQKTKGKVQEASIYRFMIDRKQQGKGYGRAALSKALEENPSDPGGEQDIDPLHARKSGCKAVLRQLRLRGGGRDRDGEVIAVLKL